MGFSPRHSLQSLQNASFFSKFCFWWIHPLLLKGLERPLQDIDLPELQLDETSATNRKKVQCIWKKSRNFGFGLFCDYLKSTVFASILLGVTIIARVSQAIVLGKLVEHFANDNKDNKSGYIWASLLVLCGLVSFPAKQHQFFETYRKGLQIRIGLVSAIYEKTTRLPSMNRNTTVGHIANLAANDVERFATAAVVAVFLIMGPLEAIAVLTVGQHIIGPEFAAGYGFLLFLVVFQIFLSRRLALLRSKVAYATDTRVGLISQIISHPRTIKMKGWEWEFENRVIELRDREISNIMRTLKIKGFNEAISYFTSLVVSVLVFTLKVANGKVLTSKDVFTTLSLFNIVQLSLAKQIPNAIFLLSECYVSSKRLDAFFDLPEVKTKHPETSSITSVGHDCCDEGIMMIKNATCYWNDTKSTLIIPEKTIVRSSVPRWFTEEAKTPALLEISQNFKSNELYFVVGKTGSGKSAFLQLLAGELQPSSGISTRKASSVAYLPQNSFIMNCSIRENIIMDHPYDEDWFCDVIDACQLTLDLKTFSNGDLTVIGDRGVQCSGGQKTRIALARAIYHKESDILLLDDPLSAVDSKVAYEIYHSAILGLGLKRGKCVVLVTHQYQFCDGANLILLDKGSIVCNGTFGDCVKASGGMLSLKSRVSTMEKKLSYSSDNQETSSTKRSGDKSTFTSSVDESQKEERSTGTIELKTWKLYGKACGGYVMSFLFFLLFTVTQVSQLLATVQVGRWSSMSQSNQRSLFSIGIILGLTGLVIILSLVRAQFSFHLLIKASKNLHSLMLKSIIMSKIEFFDTNPLGRIVNRFAADTCTADEMLPFAIYDCLVGVFTSLGGLITAIIALPFLLVILPPLIWYFWLLRKKFVTSSRELKRIEGVNRSPIFEMISESLDGVGTIRSNGATNHFKKKFEEIHDAHTRASFSFTAISRWFAWQLDCIAFLVMATAALLSVVLHDQSVLKIHPSIFGLALTMLIQIAGSSFPWTVRLSAEVSNLMIAIERILAFSSLPPEADLDKAKDKNLGDWPRGDVEVKDLSTRYRLNLPLTLEAISIKIKSGERIGIVGRTGSGKSSLLQALFRIIEADTGTITIGGVDISSIGLHKLRTSMSIIQQSPTLFCGFTIRENLDLIGQFNDKNVSDALDKVGMLDTIQILPQGIDTIVMDGGANFSKGQGQLLSLARALLDEKAIMILDEPTADVDGQTCQLLQKTLSTSFPKTTIISVAHRLDTIIDYDRILVLGDGKVLEYDSPKELLSKVDGEFTAMVKNTGEEMAAALHQRANK